MKHRAVPGLALAAAMAISAGLILHYERGLLFISDEFKFLQISGVQPASDVLEPVYGHLLGVSLVVYMAPIHLFGLARLPFSVLQIAAICGCSGALYVYARRRLGPWLALAPAILVLFLYSSIDVMVQPMIGFPIIFAVAFGLTALVVLEGRSRWGDPAACILLCLAVGSFETGLPFVVAAAVGIWLGKERRRRLYVVAIPFALYVVWRLAFVGLDDSNTNPLNVLSFPLYLIDSIAASTLALFGQAEFAGFGSASGLYLHGWDLEAATKAAFFGVLEVAAGYAIWVQIGKRGKPPATLWVALSVGAALWLLGSAALHDGRTPGETRYLFAGAVAVLMATCELARGVRLSKAATALVVGIALVGCFGNLPRLRESRTGQAAFTEQGRALLAVLLLDGAKADPDFTVWTNARDIAPFLSASAERYPELTERYGEHGTALPLAELPAQRADIRDDADILAGRLLNLRLNLRLEDTPAGVSRVDCLPATTGPGGFEIPRGGATLSAQRPGEVALGRFGDGFAFDAGRLDAGTGVLIIPPDASPVPWRARVSGSGSVDLCPLPGDPGS